MLGEESAGTDTSFPHHNLAMSWTLRQIKGELPPEMRTDKGRLQSKQNIQRFTIIGE